MTLSAKNVAELARVGLSEEELEELPLQLSSILEHVQKIADQQIQEEKEEKEEEREREKREKREKEEGFFSFFLARQDKENRSEPSLLEKLKQMFPKREGDFCRVPKIY